MLIIGCDYHPSFQQIAFVDRETGECGARKLTHKEEAESFYRDLNGRNYLVSTADVSKKGNSGIGKNKRTAEMVGGGAALGTLLGAIAGGGKGAVIGAIAGAAAGGTAQVLTKGKEVKVPAETVLKFKLDQPVTLTASY